jgi:hypothetical protein
VELDLCHSPMYIKTINGSIHCNVPFLIKNTICGRVVDVFTLCKFNLHKLYKQLILNKMILLLCTPLACNQLILATSHVFHVVFYD